MEDNKKISCLLISGSTKKKSTSGSILNYINSKFCTVFDFTLFAGIDKLPHFNSDLDTESPPVEVSNFRLLIEKSEIILICTPEYVFGPPGSLKNALEWQVSTMIFNEKRFGLIVAAANGEATFHIMEKIITTLGGKLQSESKLLIQGAKGKIDSNGILIDVEIKDRIDKIMESFI